MHILIHGTPEQVAVLTNKIDTSIHQVSVFKKDELLIPEADLYMDALFEDEGPVFKEIENKPVLVNAVITTSVQLAANTIRFNGWGGFIQQEKMEIAGNENSAQQVARLLSDVGIDTVVSADTCGMIGPRVVAMIINEAYFALAENISTREEIDIAMKSGTNYPYGPFEWSEIIGIEKIKDLLYRLRTENTRYEIAPALIKN
ncbi:3-hydroxyacyl-CoA dehydrogenase family protein [Sediminibacterium sp.]|uniref:3-hydroxyacyl-CoA dehydrogenase family protein n=1 Tax=Sediminibacterium sp. TaxID=1917865 RepID=UPI003F69E75A